MGIGSIVGKVLGMDSPKPKGPTANERELSKRAGNDYNHYLSNYRSAEHQLISQSQLSAGTRNSAKGAATTDAVAAFTDVSRGTQQAQLASGARGGSSRSVFSQSGLTDAIGTARGQSAESIDVAVDDQIQQGKMKIAAFGRNMADSSMLGLQQGATRASSSALASAAAKDTVRQARWGAIGSIAGIGASVYMNSQSPEGWKHDPNAKKGTPNNPNYYQNQGQYDSAVSTRNASTWAGVP
jgi:hypothetical protein